MPSHLEVTADEGQRRALLAQPATPVVGRAIGDFTVVSAVDAGAGVFRAVQRSLAREAIVKVLPAGQPPAPAVVDRFLKETQLASRLDHPYAAHIYAFGAEPDGLLWIAMELLRGMPLDVFMTKVEHGRLSAERFAPFLQRLAEVVDAAHEAGIVHRDIKPGNVMVLSRAGALFPKLLDFGVAALLEESRTDAARRLVGSPHYIAPEQWARPGDVAPSSDLYSLGVLSYEALTGRKPFDGPSLDAIAAAHAAAPVPRLDADRPGPLDEVLRRALAKDPRERFPSAQAFADALRAAVGPSSRHLPRISDELRDAYLVRAPRPLAEAIADLDAATHPNQALDAIHQLTSLGLRFVALIALAARLDAQNRGDEGDEVRQLLRALRRRPLADAEWLELARGLALPHRRYREAYPLPELIDLLEAESFAPLLALQVPAGPPSEGRALELLGRAVPLLERLLVAMQLLEDVRLVVGRAAGVEEWTGIRRGRRGQPLELAGALPDAAVALADADGALLVRLDPLMQVSRPLPLADAELFLLEGGDDAAARLVAPRDGFTLSDARPWERIAPLLAVAEADEGDRPRTPEQSPYLGLASFSASDAALFVGREREVERFVNRLRVQAFVGIVGPSGAGKSSFVGAGVIPALAATWRTVVVRPGPAPLDALAARLHREALCDGQLRAELDSNPDALAAELRRHAAGGPILLVVDQFEELFTLCPSAEERTRYADALARAARSADEPLRVVVTVRDDFLVRVEGLPALREKLSQGFQLLSTPEPADLLRILVEPARHVGYDFDDPTLPAEMVAQVADQPGALALLSFAALRLWEQRDRYFRRLTRRAYEEMGGVAGALAQHAESVLALMPPAEQRMVRQAFRLLVTAEGTRAVVQRDELVQVLGAGAAADRVIENLVHARLLVGSDADFGSDKLEIIHEALLAAWPRLVEWRREDGEGARLHDELRAAAQQWQRRGKNRGLLWRDDALAEYRVWRTRFPMPLSDVEAEFAAESLAAASRSRRVRQGLIGGALAVLTAGLLVVFASERRAADNAHKAELQIALLHQEKGREALVAGDPLRAVVHFAEAMRRGQTGPAVRYPLATATRELNAPLLTLDHGARLWDIATSPRGDRVATSGDDGTVRLWDGHTGALVSTIAGQGGVVRTLAFSPDGKWLLTGTTSKLAQVWDVSGEPRPLAAQLHGDAVRSAHFLPDGTHVLTAANDASVIIWDVTGATPPRTIVAHDAPLWTLELSPDGERFATGSSDRTARVWSVATGELLATMAGHGDQVDNVAFSPDGRTLATTGDDRVTRLWDSATGRLLHAMPPTTQAMHKLAFYPDGKRLVAAGADRVAVIWDVATGTTQAMLMGHTSYLEWVAVNGDGTLIATAGADGTVRVWDGETGQSLAILFGHVDSVWRLHFDGAGRLVTAGQDGLAKLWEPRRGDSMFFRGHEGPVQWASFSPDGARVLTTGNDQSARVWNAATGELIATHPLEWKNRFYLIARWDRDGRQVLVSDEDEARVIDVERGAVVSLRGHSGQIIHAAFSADGTRVITAGLDDSAKLWDAKSGRLLGSFPFHAVWIGAVAVSRDDRRIATAVDDHDIQVFDVATGASVVRIAGNSLSFHSFDFSPDGERLLSAGQDHTAKVWDLRRGAQLLSIEGHRSDVYAANWSPDGTRIVTASADGHAAVWDAATGEQLLSFATALPLSWAEFSPDGRRIVVAGDDHIAHLWNVEMDRRAPAEVVEFARCASPFRVDGAMVIRGTLDRTGCRK